MDKISSKRNNFYEEKEHMKRMLREYGYQLKRAEKFRFCANELDKTLNEETGVKGVSINNDISSKQVPVTPYINELIIEQASYEHEAEKASMEAERIWKKENFFEMLKKLTQLEKQILIDHYVNGFSGDMIATKYGYVDRAALSKKENKIFRKICKNVF